MLLFSRSAIAGVHPRLKEVSRIMGFSAFDRIRKIILPAALPGIFVGFRLAVGIALVVSVTVEITANPIGVGNAMMLAEQSLRPAEMFAFIVWIGVIGWLANAALSLLQRRLFPAAMNWGASSA
jgi:NitT/TauT family transport system permease protein